MRYSNSFPTQREQSTIFHHKTKASDLDEATHICQPPHTWLQTDPVHTEGQGLMVATKPHLQKVK